MANFQIKSRINKAFDQVHLKDKEDVIDFVLGQSQKPKLKNKVKHSYYKKAVACMAVLILLFGVVPMILLNQKSEKTKILLSASPLLINVYASTDVTENVYTEMVLDNIVSIKNTYNPVLSSADGIGIHFEFLYDGATIELSTENGVFRIWDIEKGEGPVIDAGTTYTINGKGHIFWSPVDLTDFDKTNIIKVIVRKNENVVGLALINISKNDNEHTLFASLEKSVEIPFENGHYQNIDQKYIDEFFGD